MQALFTAPDRVLGGGMFGIVEQRRMLVAVKRVRGLQPFTCYAVMPLVFCCWRVPLNRHTVCSCLLKFWSLRGMISKQCSVIAWLVCPALPGNCLARSAALQLPGKGS
jgi:hypothetical protein